MDVYEQYDIAGKVAVVTGGSSGIGRTIAEGYAAAGAQVIILARNTVRLQETCQEIRESGGRADGIPCDVASEEDVEAAFEQIISVYGRVDILVNCAGISLRKAAEETSLPEFEEVIRSNLIGTFLCSRAAGRDMIAHQSGRIINIGSSRGEVGSPLGTVAYGSSKGGIHMMTKQLATEWAKHNITVNCIIPNLTKTPLVEALMQDPAVYDMYMSRIPMKRPAEPEDYVGAAIYFASDAASFVTGQLLFVDGGSMAG